MRLGAWSGVQKNSVGTEIRLRVEPWVGEHTSFGAPPRPEDLMHLMSANMCMIGGDIVGMSSTIKGVQPQRASRGVRASGEASHQEKGSVELESRSRHAVGFIMRSLLVRNGL